MGDAEQAPVLRHIAIVDGGSFVLPYVHGLTTALAARGHRVTVFASRTRYNPEFLAALRAVPGVSVEEAAVSGSVVPRWRGVLGYAGLLWRLWRRRAAFDTINLQFPLLGALEVPFWRALGRRFVFTVHNAVPHGHTGLRHEPTARIAALGRALVFLSEATRADFARRYGDAAVAKAAVLPHGVVGLAPGEAVAPYPLREEVRTLVYWSTVKPYKGVELMAALARSAEVRARGLALEVHGRWSPELQDLRAELQSLGVRVDDAYLDADALRALLGRRDAVFLLPYRAASQSGALYTLVHHGCTVLSTDVGDLGDFMRRFGLDALLLDEATPAAVLRALDRLLADPPGWQAAWAAAQQGSAWAAGLAGAAAVYDSGP
jgi:glycosyltransferase involved in cell wall biosynthesis